MVGLGLELGLGLGLGLELGDLSERPVAVSAAALGGRCDDLP